MRKDKCSEKIDNNEIKYIILIYNFLYSLTIFIHNADLLTISIPCHTPNNRFISIIYHFFVPGTLKTRQLKETIILEYRNFPISSTFFPLQFPLPIILITFPSCANACIIIKYVLPYTASKQLSDHSGQRMLISDEIHSM